MRAWQFHTLGGAIEQKLTLATDLPRPDLSPRLGDAEILVEVLSASLNPADYKVAELGVLARAMVRLPATPAMDFCGRVAATGRTVDSFAIGELVIGRLDPFGGHGALAEVVVAKANDCVSLPAGVTPDEGAALVTAAGTAYNVIKPRVRAGDKVFINGGAGGVGTMAIQIAKTLGCHVTVSCSTGKVALCQRLGADEVLDYTAVDVTASLKQGGQAYTLVLDNVGTSPADLYQAADTYMLPKGVFVQVGGGMDWGSMKATSSKMLLPAFLGGGKRKFEFYLYKGDKETYAPLAQWAKEGKLKPVIDEVFAYEDAPKAYAKLKTGKCTGKVIVRVQEQA